MKAGARISLIIQEGTLKSTFPGCIVKRDNEERLTWTHTLTPTALSVSYGVRLVYQRYKGVKVFVTDPVLKLAEGKSSLPHVYSTTTQQLCLYYSDFREWDTGMLYTKTIVPWASEWLYHYECWVVTGVWHGGGVDHEVVVNPEMEAWTEKQCNLLGG